MPLNGPHPFGLTSWFGASSRKCDHRPPVESLYRMWGMGSSADRVFLLERADAFIIPTRDALSPSITRKLFCAQRTAAPVFTCFSSESGDGIGSGASALGLSLSETAPSAGQAASDPSALCQAPTSRCQSDAPVRMVWSPWQRLN